MAPLSPTQEKIAAILPIFSSCLSIVGSSTIIHMIWKSRKGRGASAGIAGRRNKNSACSTSSTTRQRILLLMSIIDIITSVCLVVAPFLLPSDGGRAWSFGNTASCSAVGFFTQFGMATFLYNSSLNLYYNLTIVCKKTERTIARYWEPWMHIIGLGYPLGTAIFGLIQGLYSETDVGLSCYFAATPDNLGLAAVVMMPLFFELAFLMVSNFIIFWKVRQTSRSSSAASSTTLPATSASSFSERRRGELSTIRRRTKDVAVQATCYVTAAYSVILAEAVVRIYEATGATRDDESTFYWAIVLSQATFPLQGFLNFATYIRPRYIRFRRKHVKQSRWWCLRNAVSSTSVDNPSVPVRFNRNNEWESRGSRSGEPTAVDRWQPPEGDGILCASPPLQQGDLIDSSGSFSGELLVTTAKQWPLPDGDGLILCAPPLMVQSDHTDRMGLYSGSLTTTTDQEWALPDANDGKICTPHPIHIGSTNKGSSCSCSKPSIPVDRRMLLSDGDAILYAGPSSQSDKYMIDSTTMASCSGDMDASDRDEC